MLLIVNTHLGDSLSLTVGPNETVKNFKQLIATRLDMFPHAFNLSSAGTLLQYNLSLNDYDLEDFARIDMNCDLLGGAKKRKKKVYLTPKKTKHKHKKVDSNGRITRLRRECPTDSCGAGVFMASHFDRQYCGKCTLTYMHVSK